MKSASDLPFSNKTIVLTRSIEQINESTMIFEKLGAKVILFPTIKIIPPKSWDEFDQATHKLSEFDYLIFTSPNAVKMFNGRCAELNIIPNFQSIKVTAVGKKTAAICLEKNIPVHITPYKYYGKGILKKLKENDINGKRFFIPKSAIARDELRLELEAAGGIVKTADVYDVGIFDVEDVKVNIEELSKQKPDVFIFTSPSTINNFLKIMNLANPSEYFKESIIAAIGLTTKAAIEDNKIHVDVVPDEFTMEALSEALVKFFKSK